MIQPTPQSKILIATDPIDFRKEIDGIAAICANEFEKDLSSGTLFVFVNRARAQIRVLFYDGTGYWLMSKRLYQGKYSYYLCEGKVQREQTLKKILRRLLNVLENFGFSC